jgi:hypothetical protein
MPRLHADDPPSCCCRRCAAHSSAARLRKAAVALVRGFALGYVGKSVVNAVVLALGKRSLAHVVARAFSSRDSVSLGVFLGSMVRRQLVAAGSPL